MTPAAFSTIKLEGSLALSDLEDLYENNIINTFKNMRRPPTTVTEDVSVPVQGVNVYSKPQKRLIIASRAAIQYDLVGPYLDPAMMEWKIIKEIDFHITAL